MRLKDYQTASLDKLSGYLALLRGEDGRRREEIDALAKIPEPTRSRMLAMLGDPVAAAWSEARKAGLAASPDPWRELKDGAERSIPHVCLKLPTGGGKTLIAAHGVDRILVSHFRRTTGFVLWIVPSEAIYRQTRAQLADRAHPIRQTLDRASGGRVKILEKLDGFTKADVEHKLCVLLLMLQSAGRQTKESLKVFRDSGHYISFFPQDDPPARAALLKAAPNLELADLAEGCFGGGWIKQSLGNTLRLIRPVIVLDEGHRAYSATARGTLAGLNPRFLLELSATPDRGLSNILVNVSGRALKDEEMIKLPIRVEVGRKLNWHDTLQNALDRLNDLEAQARDFEGNSGRYIRPIMLVRVDRTGRDQRDKGGELVHAEDAFDYLTHKAGVPPEAIRRQTAEAKELNDDDLLSPYCSARVIITKDALREGWDCPFAYVLAILSKGTAKTALTQMIGRVLRQPHAARTGVEALDEAHVFCADVEVGAAVENIRKGLEVEGMGDLGGEIRTPGDEAAQTEVVVRFREKFRGRRIMVPQVLHRDGKRNLRELDYEADILYHVDFGRFAWREAESFVIADYDRGRRERIAVDIAENEAFGVETALAAPVIVERTLDRPGLVRRMLDVIPNPWQGMRILDDALAVLRMRAGEEEIINARLTLVEHIKRDVQKQLEAAAEAVFRHKVHRGDIVFNLLAAPFDELNFEFQEMLKFHIAAGDERAPLLRTMGTPLERSLYETALKKDVNGFEKDVALYLDDNDAVGWWHRIAARRDWGLQGWMKNKVYPDFLVQLDETKGIARLLVLETKGKHLQGSEDTKFKSNFFELLEHAYSTGVEAGEIDLLTDRPDEMRFRILLQETAWQSDLEGAIA